jgi:single-stranded-DNA-specific exonuclease
MRTFSGRPWALRAAELPGAAALSARTGLPAAAAACLLSRAGPEADRWLRPAFAHLHDPYAMAGMEVAVARVRRAVERGEHVRIVTDYDVDGTTSSLILQSALRLLGVARLSYHIPDRFVEGYGFSRLAAEQAGADGVGLLITADIGVRDHEAVDRAAALGVDVIICDHHLPAGEAVPERALTVLCPPQVGCGYPNKALAACGVSLKLAQALLSALPRFADPAALERVLRSMLKVAAIGTVADVVDLSTLENRAIVALGLEELQRGRHSPGLRALLDCAGLKAGPITAEDLGFRVGPRINAAGRLERATAVIELFDESDPEEAARRAGELDQLNRARQGIQEELVDKVMGQLPDPLPAFLLAAGPEAEGWHRGVVGIVAARVRDRADRPAAVAAIYGDFAHGSVRSPPTVHAVHALDTVADLLVRYGGHAAAAGFTARVADLPALSRRLADYAAPRLGGEALPLELDAACPISLVGPELVTAMERLGPHGKGNPQPLLRIDGVRPTGVRTMKDKHLGFRAGAVDAVWWGAAEHAPRMQGALDLVVTLGWNVYREQRRVQLTVVDARPAEGP